MVTISINIYMWKEKIKHLLSQVGESRQTFRINFADFVAIKVKFSKGWRKTWDRERNQFTFDKTVLFCACFFVLGRGKGGEVVLKIFARYDQD